MSTVNVTRPWGSFDMFTHNEASTVKLIYVNEGEALSLQYHNKRQEFWRVISGNPCLTIGDDIKNAKPGDEFLILEGVKHRITAPSGGVTILEISTGDFDEDDIVRIEDKYNRT